MQQRAPEPTDEFELLVMRLQENDLRRFLSYVNSYDLYVLARTLRMETVARLASVLGNAEKETFLRLNVILPIGIHRLRGPALVRLMEIYSGLVEGRHVSNILADHPVEVDVSGYGEKILRYREVALDFSDECPQVVEELSKLRCDASLEIDASKFDLKKFVLEALPLMEAALSQPGKPSAVK